MVECVCLCLFGGGGYDDKEPANIHLGVVILRKFCLRYESILDPPMHAIDIQNTYASCA